MGKDPAEEWRAEQAVSGSAAPALPQADRRFSGQLLSWLQEPPGLLLPLSLPAPTVHTAIGSCSEPPMAPMAPRESPGLRGTPVTTSSEPGRARHSDHRHSNPTTSFEWGLLSSPLLTGESPWCVSNEGTNGGMNEQRVTTLFSAAPGSREGAEAALCQAGRVSKGSWSSSDAPPALHHRGWLSL